MWLVIYLNGIIITCLLALIISCVRALSAHNKVSCVQHYKFYHYRFFISIPVCLVHYLVRTDCKQLSASTRHGLASASLPLSNHRTVVFKFVLWPEVLDHVWFVCLLGHRSGRQPKTYVKPEVAVTVFELPMMGSVSPETC
jgi:hypothetical protein